MDDEQARWLSAFGKLLETGVGARFEACATVALYLAGVEAATASEIAVGLGCSVGGIYRDLRELRRIGVVQWTGRTASRGKLCNLTELGRKIVEPPPPRKKVEGPSFLDQLKDLVDDDQDINGRLR